MTKTHTPGGHHNPRAVWLMLGSVLCFSLWAITIQASGANQSPFFFNAFWSLGVVAGCFCFLAKYYRPVLFDASLIRLAARMTPSRAMLWATGSAMSVTLFTLSTRFIDVSTASVLLGTWPIIFIVAMSNSSTFQQERRYRKNLRTILPLTAMALLGFALMTISETGKLDISKESSTDLILGVSLATLAAVLSGIGSSHTYNWGTQLARTLQQESASPRTYNSPELFGAVLAFAISYTAATALNFLLALSPLSPLVGTPPTRLLDLGLPITLGSSFHAQIPGIAVALLGGFLFDAGGSILMRTSNINTDNLGINALSYSIPVFSLTWLAIFSQIGVTRPDYLVTDAAAIILSNLLINLDSPSGPSQTTES